MPSDSQNHKRRVSAKGRKRSGVFLRSYSKKVPVASSKCVEKALPSYSRVVLIESRKLNEDSQRALNSDEVRAGTNTARTATEWQDLLKNTHLGEIFGVSHFFQDKELD